MKKSEPKASYLVSKIETTIETKVSLGRIRGKLEAYPNMALVREGTFLRYVIGEEPDRFYTVEIDRTRLSVTRHL